MRYFISLFLIFLIITPNKMKAQILNVESLRKSSEDGIHGSVGLNFELKKERVQQFGISSDAFIMYKKAAHRVLFKNVLELQKVADQDLSNNDVIHFRYGYKIIEWLSYEAFTQGQFNKVSKIDLRALVGTGPRFKLTKNEKYKVYIGPLMMYEYQKLDQEENPIENNIRASIYVSFSLFPVENMAITHTSYYQPKIDYFRNFRLSSQTSLRFLIYKNLNFQTNFQYTFDQYPADDVPKSQYNLNTGIVYQFQ